MTTAEATLNKGSCDEWIFFRRGAEGERENTIGYSGPAQSVYTGIFIHQNRNLRVDGRKRILHGRRPRQRYGATYIRGWSSGGVLASGARWPAWRRCGGWRRLALSYCGLYCSGNNLRFRDGHCRRRDTSSVRAVPDRRDAAQRWKAYGRIGRIERVQHWP